MATREEHVAKDRFSQRYREERVDVVRVIEQRVTGGDWGANGYTTIAQADELAAVLELRPGSMLIDIGAGRGWPGLYLAGKTGCSLVLTDVPPEGLAIARTRSQLEGIGDRAWCVNASARRLPFTSASFDAVVHTDVLCCLRPKLTVVRECRRLLRPGGRLAFYTIHTASGLNRQERARAHRSGPWAVASTHAPAELLRRAGFVEVTAIDETDEFRETANAWIDQWDHHRAALADLYGETEFDTRQQERRVQLKAVDDGLLRRSLVIGIRQRSG